MSKITNFHPLLLPHLDGSRADQWCTFSADDGMVYLLNAGRYDVAYLIDINISDDIHFATEAACHSSAAEYYTNHGMIYPYIAEWRASLGGKADDVELDVTQSQVMEFI